MPNFLYRFSMTSFWIYIYTKTKRWGIKSRSQNGFKLSLGLFSNSYNFFFMISIFSTSFHSHSICNKLALQIISWHRSVWVLWYTRFVYKCIKWQSEGFHDPKCHSKKVKSFFCTNWRKRKRKLFLVSNKSFKNFFCRTGIFYLTRINDSMLVKNGMLVYLCYAYKFPFF